MQSVVITPIMSLTGSSISKLLDVFSEQAKLFRERQLGQRMLRLQSLTVETGKQYGLEI